jgi:hypothetical protein
MLKGARYRCVGAVLVPLLVGCGPIGDKGCGPANDAASDAADGDAGDAGAE